MLFRGAIVAILMSWISVLIRLVEMFVSGTHSVFFSEIEIMKVYAIVLRIVKKTVNRRVVNFDTY